jgi:hypothetical protein
MRQSLDQFEEAFERESIIEKKRREDLRKRAANRSRARNIVKGEQKGKVRFSVLDLGRRALVAGAGSLVDRHVDLLAEDRDVAGGVDADADLVAGNGEDRNLDLIADHDALVRLPREYQHSARPPGDRLKRLEQPEE